MFHKFNYLRNEKMRHVWSAWFWVWWAWKHNSQLRSLIKAEVSCKERLTKVVVLVKQFKEEKFLGKMNLRINCFFFGCLSLISPFKLVVNCTIEIASENSHYTLLTHVPSSWNFVTVLPVQILSDSCSSWKVVTDWYFLHKMVEIGVTGLITIGGLPAL